MKSAVLILTDQNTAVSYKIPKDFWIYLFCTQFSLKLTKCLINVYILTPHDLPAAFLLVAFTELLFLFSGQNDFPTEQFFGAWELFCLSVLLYRVVPTS